MFQFLDELVDDGDFVFTVAGLSTGDGGAVASVNFEGETTDFVAETCFAENVPVFLDDCVDAGVKIVGATVEVEVAVEFNCVALGVKLNYVVARGKGFGGVEKRPA